MTGVGAGAAGPAAPASPALEPRRWVRLTWACNNRCAFCLDAGLADGRGHVPETEAAADLAAGRAAGAPRLILSGGEPTLHPAFLRLVAAGRAAGYRSVQVITNGRMLAYRGFLAEAVAAGLGEVTLSLHAHEPATFARLTGVPEAHAQALQGLRHALAEPGLIVSVDVVLTRWNTPGLAATLNHFADLGVREFDLLHLTPFGRAWDPATGTVPLAVDPAVERRALGAAIDLADRRGLVVWTNRVPAPLLEGHEAWLQDPHKLLDEVRGRHAHLARATGEGLEMPCYGVRCRWCYLAAFCAALHEAIRDPVGGPVGDEAAPPPCLGGPAPAAPRLRPDPAEVVDAAGRVDPDRFAAWWVREGWREKSDRCRGCRDDARCPGLPIAAVRARGFGALRPR